METITKSVARSLKMRPLTIPFIGMPPSMQRVCGDMQSAPGTVWAIVDLGGGLREIWRVPAAPLPEYQFQK